jgi:hypothetical protein
VPMDRMRVRQDKVELAKVLWPILRAKFGAELAADNIKTPVLKLVVDVRQLVARLTGIFALRGPT